MTSPFAYNYCKPEVVKNLQVIHFGSSRFDFSHFTKVRNPKDHENAIKPLGGLWTCPTDAFHTWEDECLYHGIFQDRMTESFRIKFRESTKILLIDSYEDLAKLPMVKEPTTDYQTFIDWEEIGRIADAIWLTEQGLNATHCTLPYNLTTWYVETVFIFNAECIALKPL